MRRVLLAAVFISACTAITTAQSGPSRIDRLERWLAAVVRHEPGRADSATDMVASWSIRDLRMLWVDLNSLVVLTRNPKMASFTIRSEGRRQPEAIRYTSLEHARQLFPDDSVILFLSGCFHEAFASPPVQSVVRSVTLPYGVTFGVDAAGVERRRAERFFRRVLELDPGFIEARLR